MRVGRRVNDVGGKSRGKKEEWIGEHGEWWRIT